MAIKIIGWVIILAFFALMFLIRFWIGGSNLECVFSEDPALCSVILNK